MFRLCTLQFLCKGVFTRVECLYGIRGSWVFNTLVGINAIILLHLIISEEIYKILQTSRFSKKQITPFLIFSLKNGRKWHNLESYQYSKIRSFRKSHFWESRWRNLKKKGTKLTHHKNQFYIGICLKWNFPIVFD